MYSSVLLLNNPFFLQSCFLRWGDLVSGINTGGQINIQQCQPEKRKPILWISCILSKFVCWIPKSLYFVFSQNVSKLSFISDPIWKQVLWIGIVLIRLALYKKRRSVSDNTERVTMWRLSQKMRSHNPEENKSVDPIITDFSPEVWGFKLLCLGAPCYGNPSKAIHPLFLEKRLSISSKASFSYHCSLGKEADKALSYS